ncbi:hypothetical protein P691DRAFT_782372 [Macrolepiota fuliginosa MF-IS2]|uniref:Uncharacterized protein n=1 Tax=Macrolepiota fuliginosa MF-IS2 TaxID=1400762 RepID=A0A9P5WZ55_9AGAR|nr:hypothetical protein P691DRAFT_782372 [Macrolepiota fuliginosa MF-IS2]
MATSIEEGTRQESWRWCGEKGLEWQEGGWERWMTGSVETTEGGRCIRIRKLTTSLTQALYVTRPGIFTRHRIPPPRPSLPSVSPPPSPAAAPSGFDEDDDPMLWGVSETGIDTCRDGKASQVLDVRLDVPGSLCRCTGGRKHNHHQKWVRHLGRYTPNTPT